MQVQTYSFGQSMTPLPLQSMPGQSLTTPAGLPDISPPQPPLQRSGCLQIGGWGITLLTRIV
jgi:hypothetical protein